MQKMERGKRALFVSFAIPVAVMVAVFLQRGIFPFGDACFLRTDLYHQYAPFFSEFREKLTHGESLFYSWNVGLGVNFSAIYAYYLASPANWLIALCPRPYIIEFITVMIVIKTGLSGLTMTWYLLEHGRRKRRCAALFGIFYALSAYMAAYSWNVMWLDCIILFPLIVRGVEKIFSGEDCLLYTISLALCIGSNFYISIMICMFLVLYALSLIFLFHDNMRKNAISMLQFAICSLVAGGIASVIVIPEIFALQSTASGNFTFPKTFESYFSILDMLSRHLANVECETGLKHWPNLYCGTAVLQLSLLYFLNRRIPLREKAVYGFFLIFLLAGFSINVLNYIWHGFHYPNSLPARQSFVYVFLVLYVCYRTLDVERGNTKKDLFVSFSIAFAFILFCQKFGDKEYFHASVCYVALALLSFYAGMLYLWRSRKIKKSLLLLILFLAVSVESAVNLGVTSVPTTSRKEYLEDNDSVRTLRDMAPKNDFYRFEKVKRKSKDDGAWLNFHSVSLFSSTAQKTLSDFLRCMGCESSVNAYSITGSTPLTDAMLSVRYAFHPAVSGNRSLKEIGRAGEMVLYENPDTFPLAYVVDSDLDTRWTRTMENPAEVQNTLCRTMEVPDVLEEIPVSQNGTRASFVAVRGGEYYAFSQNAKVDQIKGEFPDGIRKYENLKRRYFMELGTLCEGESVTFENDETNSKQNIEVKVYRFRYEALKALKRAMVLNPMRIETYSDTVITASVHADDAAVLLTSIPYDDGWKVMMDGILVETEPYLDTFLSFRIPAGEHDLKFQYIPRGFREGVFLTSCSLLFLFLCMFKKRRRKRRGIKNVDPLPESEVLNEKETYEKREKGEEGMS